MNTDMKTERERGEKRETVDVDVAMDQPRRQHDLVGVRLVVHDCLERKRQHRLPPIEMTKMKTDVEERRGDILEAGGPNSAGTRQRCPREQLQVHT